MSFVWTHRLKHPYEAALNPVALFSPKPHQIMTSSDVKHWISNQNTSRLNILCIPLCPLPSDCQALSRCYSVRRRLGSPHQRLAEWAAHSSHLPVHPPPWQPGPWETLKTGEKNDEGNHWLKKKKEKLQTTVHRNKMPAISRPHHKRSTALNEDNDRLLQNTQRVRFLCAYCFSAPPFWEPYSPVWVSGWPAAGSGCSRWLSSALQTCWAATSKEKHSVKRQ